MSDEPELKHNALLLCKDQDMDHLASVQSEHRDHHSSSVAREAPVIIYLQDGCDDPDCLEGVANGHDYGGGVTWCADQIHRNDTKYIRFDIHERALAAASGKAQDSTGAK